MLVFLFLSPSSIIFSQTTKSSISDPDVKTKLQKVKDNIDHMFQTFKTNKPPDPEVNFDDSYYTNLKFYNVKGTVSSNNFDENMSFRISTSDYKKATRIDFEKTYTELSENLKNTFDFLEIREARTDDIKELTLFEKGKDTNLPVADPGSPKYYIKLKFSVEKDEKKTGYSIFLYFTSKK